MSKLSDYLKGSKEELAKVVWPSRQTTINHTLVVIAISLIVAIFLGAIDYGLSKVLELVLIK
ncbi:MAG: preprotein translocase subunit SecE [Patescibacteria group bacterium]|jgi:preprotein translocase subunit SecE